VDQWHDSLLSDGLHFPAAARENASQMPMLRRLGRAANWSANRLCERTQRAMSRLWRQWSYLGLKMKLILLLTSLLFLGIPQEPKIVTCTYSKANESVVCVQTRTEHKTTGIVIPAGKIDLSEWRLVAPMQGEGVNSDAPLSEADLTDKQEVKAIIDGNKLIPVASCKVRVWRRLKDYTSQHPGERVPFGLRTEDDDCQPWYGKI